MKGKTKIKTYNQGNAKSIIRTIGYVTLSLLIGFAIAYFGKGTSYIEESFITISLTLFGFDLTSVIFMCGTIQHIKVADNARINVLLKEIAESLGFMLGAILLAIILDFLTSVIHCPQVLCLVIKTLKYGSLCCSLISQLDIISAFLRIVKVMPEKRSDPQ